MTLHDLAATRFTLADVVSLCQANDDANGDSHFRWQTENNLALCTNTREGGEFLYCVDQLIAADFDVDQNHAGLNRLCPHTPTHPEIR